MMIIELRRSIPPLSILIRLASRYHNRVVNKEAHMTCPWLVLGQSIQFDGLGRNFAESGSILEGPNFRHRRRQDSTVIKRSVVVGGHKTSVSEEDGF
jgi:hypothetical protein